LPITSVHNPHLLEIKRAAAHGRLTSDGGVVAEGPHLLGELFRSRWRVKEVFLTAEARLRYAELLAGVECPLLELPARTLRALSTTESTQGIIAIAYPRPWTWTDVFRPDSVIVVLDGIQDPGNAGAIVRSAEAFGASGIVLTAGTVHFSNGKLLRASAGSMFRVPYVYEPDRQLVLERLLSSNTRLYALSAQGNAPLSQAEFSGGCALIVGSEGAGVSSEFLRAAETVYIQTSRVESLNAGVACSIALYEAARRRNS
jgi:TrmH family RNA methyltransferase